MKTLERPSTLKAQGKAHLHAVPSLPKNLSWSAKTVVKLLSAMRKGQLTLYFPDGSVYPIGQEPDSSFQAAIQVNEDRCFNRIIQYGHIGFAEAYLDGEWDTPDLEAVIAWFILNIEDSTVLEGSKNKVFWVNLLGKLNRLYHLLRANNVDNSKKNIHEHYDLGNEFFQIFLDPTMTYSSARFTHPEQSLEAAQISKYDALCQKLQLQPSDRVLEIGTGWGGFAMHAARNYGCTIDTTTISEEQFKLATARIAAAGLSDQITVHLQDYRKLSGQYDKIVSIEMLEAVGDAYLDTYFAQCSRLLKPHGLLGIQYITCPDSRYELLKNNVDFIQKHIFPGSLLPSVGRVNQAINRTGNLFLHDLEDLGNSYAKTLQLWYDAFNANLSEVRRQGFDERFIRKWNYYLMYCKAAFRMRNISVVQAIYTNPNNLSLWQAL
ncbi:SAM-dependent methyltransferase [Vampirovibrio chlorellavorus]|uniref:SAM-dependent methyltransferase n=1 Tax=Vampirovibrio chlorellavorus TaxID=758823 RepID=UPI0026EED957|nr:cyclopropane-fatty-acyl-phospholipid synthase family protein [Vampirovibrio chlorellavorus]